MKGLSQRLSNLVIFMDLIRIEGELHTMRVAHFFYLFFYLYLYRFFEAAVPSYMFVVILVLVS